MLAGAAGIDLALLVVAADDGVMPQTREHLAILDLLGVDARRRRADQGRSASSAERLDEVDAPRSRRCSPATGLAGARDPAGLVA